MILRHVRARQAMLAALFLAFATQGFGLKTATANEMRKALIENGEIEEGGEIEKGGEIAAPKTQPRRKSKTAAKSSGSAFSLKSVAVSRLDCDSAYYGKAICDEANLSKELTCLAKGVYFESRGEPTQGKKAVAKVILNRVANPRYPETICGVVYQGSNGRGCQFSWTCDGHADRLREPSAWQASLAAATGVLENPASAPLGAAATNFHTTSVNPGWRMRRVAQIGVHLFYAP